MKTSTRGLSGRQLRQRLDYTHCQAEFVKQPFRNASSLLLFPNDPNPCPLCVSPVFLPHKYNDLDVDRCRCAYELTLIARRAQWRSPRDTGRILIYSRVEGKREAYLDSRSYLHRPRETMERTRVLGREIIESCGALLRYIRSLARKTWKREWRELHFL